MLVHQRAHHTTPLTTPKAFKDPNIDHIILCYLCVSLLSFKLRLGLQLAAQNVPKPKAKNRHTFHFNVQVSSCFSSDGYHSDVATDEANPLQPLEHVECLETTMV